MDLIFSKRLKKYVLLRQMRAFIKAKTFKTFLRKEVIQPQVPLRLPCYDFTPVADPTVVGCLHCWLAHHRRVEPTPMV